jgi:glycosyltransferase involved in cell wall biosynthesis
MNISVVLPCYNERENIGPAIADVAAWMMTRQIDGTIIIVDDGSKDGSAEILAGYAKKNPNITIITHEKNRGYGLAVRSGCDAAVTEWIAFMDSDGQFRAADLDLLLARTADFPFVTGRRRHRADGFVRNTFGKILGCMNLVILGLWVRDVNCGMKLFRRDIWPQIRPTKGVEKLFNTEMFLRLKRKRIPWTQVDVPHYPRMHGNPTGGSVRVILRMFKELWDLRLSALN